MIRLNEMTDEELALSYVRGNNQAFDLLLSRNQSKLFSYILFVVHEQDLANDIFQETFVKVITKLQEGRYIDSGKFSAWIMRIAHNVIMDWYRDNRAKNIVETSDDNDLSNVTGNDITDFNIEDRYVNEQVLRDVKKMMNLLPPTQREIVFMRFYQEMSFKEIAETTGVSINTALGRMRYAILNMRRMARKNKLSLETVY
ncbi:sigma-70 family RNA polymerase sigma factor [Prevotella pectinovora]|jgi:RNA polymerase sigma factor (sigma-70 family)|uniref:Contig28, whole genome shotgun sequence n=1 Tax=Prevotella pectinovora TaxID=1602169 RepID=A0A0D0I7M3_9BACT|nr:sigma-70 family RNA polymerase sigma factor [Prevotella pectinovora]KIP55588.1 RNA polymerase subunit sigma-24 [Prevotella pectinovora]KIP59768.1 RNA polymerase subunit sigma-24 [Prevotella pectinovora]KIP62654.1 RNA polymerase subunit sigma-24 [Prevotella pectinovora]KIP64242.1 RNA polymerase subunit sigma-24 [Prevotella pectinovora]MCI6047866.1 sigma-70 family RNA polymerase sigma factor [Prevotella pectinovora]